MAVSRAQVLPVGPPVLPQWQIGREGDIARLTASLIQGDHVVLAEERRTGKTTVGLAALEDLAEDGNNVIVAVDLSRAIDTGKAFDDAIGVQVAAQRSALVRGAQEAGNLALRLWNLVRGAGALEGEEAQAIDAIVNEMRGATDRAVGWTLDAAVELAQEKGGRAIVFIDEAQVLQNLDDADAVASQLLGRMRQPETPMTFLFAGSEPSLVRTLFDEGGLLEFDAHDFRLSPIDPQPWREGLRRAFRARTGGHPHRTMLVANRVHEEAEFAREPVIDDALAGTAIERAKESRLWEPRE